MSRSSQDCVPDSTMRSRRPTRSTKLVPSVEIRSSKPALKKKIGKRSNEEDTTQNPTAKRLRCSDFAKGTQLEGLDVETSATTLVQKLSETRHNIKKTEEQQRDLSAQIEVAKTFIDDALSPLIDYSPERLETLKKMFSGPDDDENIYDDEIEFKLFVQRELQLQVLVNEVAKKREAAGTAIQLCLVDKLKTVDGTLEALKQTEEDLSTKVNVIAQALLPFSVDT